MQVIAGTLPAQEARPPHEVLDISKIARECLKRIAKSKLTWAAVGGFGMRDFFDDNSFVRPVLAALASGAGSVGGWLTSLYDETAEHTQHNDMSATVDSNRHEVIKALSAAETQRHGYSFPDPSNDQPAVAGEGPSTENSIYDFTRVREAFHQVTDQQKIPDTMPMPQSPLVHDGSQVLKDPAEDTQHTLSSDSPAAYLQGSGGAGGGGSGGFF